MTGATVKLGPTSLMYACQQGKESQVYEIIKSKPGTILERERSLKTALHYCAESGEGGVESATALLHAAPELVHAQDQDGYTALHLAVIAGNVPLARLLIAHNAGLNTPDKEGHTAAHWATVCGELECLELILKKNGDPNRGDMHGGCPLHYAAQMCGPGSEMPADRRIGMTALRLLIDHGADPNIPDNHSRQPILWAASAGSGTSYDSSTKSHQPRDGIRCECLHEGINCATKGSSEAILVLTNAGANVESADKDGLTALHCAASRGHIDCVETLISLCNAETDVIDNNGCSALFYAVTLGHADCTQVLLNHGANTNRQDRKGRTAMHCGAAKGQMETLKVIWNRGGNLWTRTARGDYPLHEAVTSGRCDLVTWLLSLRPDAVNSPNNDGRCPLHLAAIHNNVEMSKILLDAGSLVNPVMRTGKGLLATPLDAALHKGHRGTAKYLQLHGGVPAGRLNSESAALRGPNSRNTGIHIQKSREEEKDHSKENMIPAKTLIQPPQQNINLSAQRHNILQVYIEDGVMIKRLKQPQILDDERVRRRRRKRKTRHVSDKTSQIEKEKHKRDNYEDSTEEEGVTSQNSSFIESLFVTDSDTNVVRKKGHDLPQNIRKPATENNQIIESEKKYFHGSQNLPDSEESNEISRHIQEVEVELHRSFVDEEESPNIKDLQDSIISKNNEDLLQSKALEYNEEKTFDLSNLKNNDHEESIQSDITIVENFSNNKIKRSTDETKDSVVADENEIIVLNNVEIKSNNVNEAEGAANIKNDNDKLLDQSNENHKRKLSIHLNEEADLTNEDKNIQEDGSIHNGAIVHEDKAVHEDETVYEDEAVHNDEKTIHEDEAVHKDEKTIHEDETVLEYKAVCENESAVNEAIPKDFDTNNVENKLQKGEMIGETSEYDGQAEDASIFEQGNRQELNEETRDKALLSSELVDGEPLRGEQISNEIELQRNSEILQSVHNMDANDRDGENNSVPHVNDYDDKNEDTGQYATDLGLNLQEQKKQLVNEKDKNYTHSSEVLVTESETNKKNEEHNRMVEDMPMVEQPPLEKQPQEAVAFDHSYNPQNESLNTEPEIIQHLLDNNSVQSGSDVDLAEISEQHLENTSVTGGTSINSRGLIKVLDNDSLSLVDMKKTKIKPKRKEWKRHRTQEKWEPRSISPQHEDGAEIDKKSLHGAPEPQDSFVDLSPQREKKNGVKVVRPKSKSRIPRMCAKNERDLDDIPLSTVSVTQAVQYSVRKYHLERRIFHQLLELKRLQIRAGRSSEGVLVKRLVDDYRRAGLMLGLQQYNGVYTFRAFERYLYDQLRLLQSSERRIIPRLKSSDDLERLTSALRKTRAGQDILTNIPNNPALCTYQTHRCYHATHAYTGIPCAAYIRRDHHTMPKPGSFLPKLVGERGELAKTLRFVDPKRPLTLELSHGSEKQVITLPTEKLDKSKRYFVTFTIKTGNQKNVEGNNGHAHASSV